MFDRATSERDSVRVLLALRRRWWVIVLIAVLSAGGAYYFAGRKPKEYRASAALLFRDQHLDQQLFGNAVLSTTDPARTAATNQALVGLPAVSTLVAQQLGISPGTVRSAISVGSDQTSDLLGVSATDTNPRLAAAIVNAYVNQYINFRQREDRSQLAQAEGLVNTALAKIPPSQQNTPAAQNLQQKALELKLLASLQTGGASVVQTAGVPHSPVSPNPSQDAIIGLLLGLVVAGALVAVLERRDRRIKSTSEVEEVYGIPVVANVPESSALRAPYAIGTPRDREAFSMMRAQLRYFDVDRDIRRVMVTSADTGEGKSLISLNLIRAAAQADDKRALLIEADLRRPSLSRTIGYNGSAGLAELLSHSQDLASGLRELVITPETPDGGSYHFDILPAGAQPPNPAELLESQRMRELLDYAETAYDLVIIDTPPISVISDAISLVHQVDGVLLVSRVGVSRRDRAVRLMKQLRGLNAHLLGVVVNSAQEEDTRGHYAYYLYQQHRADEPPRSGRWSRAGGARED